jgi:hypothetical protein
MASNVLTRDDNPPNFKAFEKRQKKWLGGAFKFSLDYLPKVFLHKKHRKHYTWYERISILQVANIWIMPLLSLFWLLYTYGIIWYIDFSTWTSNLFVLPWWIFALGMIFFFSGYFCMGGKAALSKASLRKNIWCSLVNTMLYSVMFVPITMRCIQLVFGFKPIFNNTIKKNSVLTVKQVFKENWFTILITWIMLAFFVATAIVTRTYLLLVNPFIVVLFISIIALIPINLMSNKPWDDSAIDQKK